MSAENPAIVLLPTDCQALVLGHTLKLTPTEYRLLEALVQANGSLVTREALHAAAYHDRAEQPQANSLEVLVCRIRKKLKATGAGDGRVRLLTAWRSGYRLLLGGAP